MSRVYVCPWCGLPFGRVRTSEPEWFPERRACSACPNWPSVETSSVWPGSLIDWRAGWDAYQHDPFEGLSRQDLEWELTLLDRGLTLAQFFPDNGANTEVTVSDMQTTIAELRAKSIQGIITDAELREAIRLLREDRIAAHATSARAKARKSSAPVDAGALANMFGL